MDVFGIFFDTFFSFISFLLLDVVLVGSVVRPKNEVGSGAKEFMQELIEARCYNNSGMEMVRTASEELLFYIILQVASAVLSLILAPLSAYFGGKLIGVPYVK